LAPLLADALQHRQVAWFHREQLIWEQCLPAPALGLSRYALDARLANAFTAAGGELRRSARANDPAPAPGRVLAHGRIRSESPWLGLKLHVHGLRLTQDLELHLGQHAYVGLAKVETGAVNLCGLFRRRSLSAPGPDLVTRLSACRRPDRDSPTASRSLRSNRRRLSAVSALSYAPAPPSPNTIRLGDANGLIPPFTGNGMAVAFQSAETALPHVLAYAGGEVTWPIACARTNLALRQRFLRRLSVARNLHPFSSLPLAKISSPLWPGAPAPISPALSPPSLTTAVATLMFLHALATAVPPATFMQSQCWDIVEKSAVRSRLHKRSRLILHSILRGDHGIATRHFAAPDIENIFDRTSDRTERHLSLRRSRPRRHRPSPPPSPKPTLKPPTLTPS